MSKSRARKSEAVNKGLPTIEVQMKRALQRRGVSAADLARTLQGTRAGISRDLRRGLRIAKVHRIALIASAIGHDVVVAIVPRTKRAQAVRELLRRALDAD